MNFMLGLLCVYLSPFFLLAYALYANAYAAIHGWDAWQRKVDAWDKARIERLRKEGESAK